MERVKIGEGSYGCVHRPALECLEDKDYKGNTVDYSDTISKLLKTSDAVDEMGNYRVIQSVDKEQKYYTGPPVLCGPKKNQEYNSAVNSCKLQDYTKGSVSLMIMKDGGKDLGNFAKTLSKMDSTNIEHLNFVGKIVDDFWLEMLKILEGLELFLKKDVIHYDLKDGNILYDWKKKRANFIDFGLMTKKDKIVNDANSSNCPTCISWWSYPFENQFLKKDAFNEEYKKLNSKLFLITLDDIFSDSQSKNENLDVKIMDVQNKKDELIEKAKRADIIPIDKLNTKSKIVILYRHLKSEYYQHFLIDYIKGIESFFKQHDDWTYDSFLEKSLSTVDIYGIGIAFLYVLKHAKPFMKKPFFDDIYKLSFRMITPDLKVRYTISPLLSDYKKILKKHIPNYSSLKIPKSNTVKIPKGNTEGKPMADCPEGKVRNPLTGRCIKEKTKVNAECPEGKVRNPLTGRCIKEKTKVNAECPEGKVRNPLTGRCIKEKTKVNAECPEGKVRNPLTGRCIKERTKKNKVNTSNKKTMRSHT